MEEERAAFTDIPESALLDSGPAAAEEPQVSYFMSQSLTCYRLVLCLGLLRPRLTI